MGKITAADIAKKFSAKSSKVSVTTLDTFEPLDILNGTIDTTSKSLNSIICGSPLGGIPIGRTTGFYGPSGCGKSFIVGCAMAEAQNQGFIPILVDTENAWTSNAEGYGLDVENCLKIDGEVIEDVRNDVVALVSAYDEEIENGDVKFVVVIDSLAGLRCAKEVRDVADGKDASDMGQRAKAMKSMCIALKAELGQKRGITLVWTNHMIADPGQSFRSSIQKMPGGFAIIYMSDVIVGMKRVESKNDGENTAVERNDGARIPIECVKQRFVRPFSKADMFISYQDGILPYYGLFELALEYDVITGSRTYALRDGTKLGYRKDIEANPELWDTKIIPLLDIELQARFGFGSQRTKELLESLNDEE